MGTFHHDRGPLHGITVAVDTTGEQVFIGKCDIMDDEKVVLEHLDVRTAGEYATGHIPGAQSEPLVDLAVDPAATLVGLENQGFILYDQGPPGATLYDVARRLEEAGFMGVYVYGAGYADWEASGKPVE